jgi:hypothetical protein
MSDEVEITEDEAQRIHDARRTADPEHDSGSCWCCCIDCDFDVRAIIGNAQ